MGYLRSRTEARQAFAMQQNRIAEHVLSPVRLLTPPGANQIICLMTVRDESLRLPDCLRHHRAMGVSRFVVVDNISTDGTAEFLLDQPDVDLLQTADPYKDARSGFYWLLQLAKRYGMNRWYLTIDADELLVYEDYHRRDLHDLRDLLTSWGSKAFFAPMIDMYPRGPISEGRYEPGDSMIAACPYFDGSSYQVTKTGQEITAVAGGPRVRLLNNSLKVFNNYLGKYPFFLWDDTAIRKNVHNFKAYRNRPSPSGALLHFKFLPDLGTKVAEGVASGAHWNGGAQYKQYAEAIEDGRFETLFYEDSAEFTGPESLISLGLMNRLHFGTKRPTNSLVKSLFTQRPLRTAIKSIT